MKKIISIFLAVVMICSIGIFAYAEEDKTSCENAYDMMVELTKSNGTVITDGDFLVEAINTFTAEAEFTNVKGTDFADAIMVSNMVLIDNSDFKISIKKAIEKSLFGPTISFVVENKTTRDIDFYIDDCNVIINGWNITAFGGDTIPAKSKSVVEMNIYASSLEDNDITLDEITSIFIFFNVYDMQSISNYWKNIEVGFYKASDAVGTVIWFPIANYSTKY